MPEPEHEEHAETAPGADERLLAARDLALAALHEITPASSVGEPAGHLVEADGVVSLLFANKLAGYPGWFWTVSLARVEDEDPTVLEVELLPGESALLAPEWVPWAERLAEYRAQQAQAAAAEAEAALDALAEGADDDLGEDEDDDLDDDDLDEDEADDDLDDDEFDADVLPILHSGDVDGVDIDELDDDEDLDDEDGDDEDDAGDVEDED